MVKLLDLFEITPLWQKQNSHDQNLIPSLIFGLLGLTFSYFSIQLWITSSFTNALFKVAGITIPAIFRLLSKFGFNIIITIIVDMICFFFLSSSKYFLRDIDIIGEWKELVELVHNTYELEERKSSISKALVIYVSATFFLGLLAGIFYSIYLYIPFFTLFMLIFLLIFTQLNSTSSIVISVFLAWIIIYILLVKRKLSSVDEEEKLVSNVDIDFQFSDRTYNILASNEPPIICNACKSYISAESITCQVCGEKITSSAQ